MRVLITILATLAAAAGPALACTQDEFAKAVDEAGARMRAYNAEAAPGLNAKLRQLGAKRGWKESEVEERALAELADQKFSSFDATANELLDKIDTLGRVPNDAAPDCAKLDELKAAGLELLAVMKAKTAYMSTRVEAELARPAGGDAAPADKVAEKPAEKSAEKPSAKPSDKPVDKPADKVAAATPPKAPPAPPAAQQQPPKPASPAPQTAAKPKSDAWSTTTEQVAIATPGQVAPPPPAGAGQPPAPGQLPQGALLPPEEGYTIDEVQEISRGFFGTISTGLASVIEHAFSQSGRPSAYVLGTEGGGAFLAGLRYGEGTLYLRAGGTRKVHWHGPSLGYDIGAAGSRTLFLIYGLHDPNALFRHFTGIDGSAYVIGGVGITYLQGGGVIMAPIRSGIGLRVGANVGYIRFTPEPSWNPF